MSDTLELEPKKPDYIRDVIAWLLSALIIALLCFLKPPVVIRESAMYLPKITNLRAIDKDEVKIITEGNVNNYILYDKVGLITITSSYSSANEKQAPYDAIEHARNLAAQAGASKLLVEHIVTSPWFDTGNTVLRIQAIALK